MFSEKGYYSSREDLSRVVESRFSETVACVGNPGLMGQASAVKVLEDLLISGPTWYILVDQPSLPDGGVCQVSRLLQTSSRGECGPGSGDVSTLSPDNSVSH